ncbi:MAG: hypothetical protein FJ317_04425 [SAR202 cluster bacterium]|nr:hypothetical protein [SAR202 cluster bacterium]
MFNNHLRTVLGIALIVVLAAACSGPAAAPAGSESSEPTATQATSPQSSPTAAPTATAVPDAMEYEFGEPVETDEEANHVAAGIPVRLKLGQQMISPPSSHTGLAITFDSVVENTLCPAGETCAEPGQVSIRVEMKVSTGGLGGTVFTLTSDQTEPTVKKLGRYSVAFLEYDQVTGRATFVVFEQ